MPHVVLHLPDALWADRGALAGAVDAALAVIAGFDTTLCKYRLVRAEELVVADVRASPRRLTVSEAVRCELITFDDRPAEVLAAMTTACARGIGDALAALGVPVPFSVAVAVTDRASYRSTVGGIRSATVRFPSPDPGAARTRSAS
ncbi:MAG: hypothetical protein QG608_1111 [Actinomycetota bacterium]|nr:hypothetical protein [Actinomycetota bacterium]